MMPWLLSGYRPARLDWMVEAQKVSHPTDRSYEGPNLTISDIRKVASDSTRAPASTESKARLIILDMDGATRDAQNALLRLIEDAPWSTQLLLTVTEPSTVIPTVASRCAQRHFTLPAYSERLRDLANTMSVGAASQTAARLERGHSVERVPDDAAYSRAQALLDASQKRDIEMAIDVVNGFDWRSVSALRELLSDAGHYAIVADTHEAVSVEGAAWIVYYRRGYGDG